MSYTQSLINQKDGFSKADIENTSQHLFELFRIGEDVHKLNEKIEILGLFIKTLSKALRSDLIIEKSEKADIMETIAKLKMQQETLELLQSENINEATKNLQETAERFGKKAQSSVTE